MSATVQVPVTDAAGAEDASAVRATWDAFRRNPLGIAALVAIAFLTLVALCAPLLAHYPRNYGGSVLTAPSAAHWFGTDNLGREVFAEVVWGTRISMAVGACSSALAIAFGVTVAVLAAYFPRVDPVVGVVVDLLLSLPVLPLMILVAALTGPSLGTIIVVIAFFSWPEVTRVVRSQALSVVRLPYVEASRAIGGNAPWIIRRHVLPAVAPVVVVTVVLTASRAVLSEAGLSFLGLGDPNRWSWGRVLYEAQQSGAMQSAWWTTLFPSLAILVLVVSASLTSIAYNDAQDPRMRRGWLSGRRWARRRGRAADAGGDQR